MPIWSAEIKELEKLFESFKGQFPDLEKEVGQLIHFDDPNVILLYSRRCLEVIITDLCECELKRPRKTEPLKGIIDKLNKEGKAPPHIVASMQSLNGLSTFGTHPKEFDPEQVKPVLVNLDIIIKWYLRYKSIDIILKDENKIQVEVEKPKEVEKEAGNEQQEEPLLLTKNRLQTVVLITSVLVVAAILLYPKIFKSNTIERLKSSDDRIPIAVMPFRNLTGDTTKNIWQDNIQYNISNVLSGTEYLEVRQIEFINNLIKSRDITDYASLTSAVATSIAKKLDADILIDGNIGQTGSIVRFNAQVIETKTGRVLKPFQIDSHITSEMDLHSIDSLSKMVMEFLVVSEMKNKTSRTNLVYGSLTNSPEAFRFFTLGKNAFEKKDYPSARNYLLKALSIDPNYFYASVLIIYSYANAEFYKQAKELTSELNKRKNEFRWDQQIYLDYLNARYFETPYEAIILMKQLVDMDSQIPNYHYLLGVNYSSIFQYDKAILEFEKALEIYEQWESKPWWIENYTKLCDALLKTGKLRYAKKILTKAEKDFPEDPGIIYYQAICALSSGKKNVANKYIENYLSIMNEASEPEVKVDGNLARIYWNAKLNDKAEEYFRRAFSLEPGSAECQNNLARFLIETDRNLDEGIELADRALLSDPGNFNFLDCRGWGLFKRGKYEEALETLQKSWVIRKDIAMYDHEAYLHLVAAKKAVANQ